MSPIVRSLLALSFVALPAAVQAGTVSAPAAPAAPAAAAAPSSPFDALWNLAKLYKNDANPWLEELAFTGRYQGQYYHADGEEFSDDDWENRRFRLGLKAKLWDKKLEFNGEMFSNLVSGEDFYAGLKNFNLTWKSSDALALTVGKLEPHFGYDYNRSDTQMVTFERTAMVNEFGNDYMAGATVSGKSGNWRYYGGVYSNEADQEFGSFAGAYSLMASVGYDLKEATGLDRASVQLDYLHSEHDVEDTNLTQFDNGLAATFEMKQGRCGLVTEVVAGFGETADAGIMIMPTYDISKKLQLVTRYQFDFSDDANGLKSQSRYERRAGTGSGDCYNALYAGLNYYIYDYKLKVMGGVEYSNMDGGKAGSQDTVTALAGLRVSW